MRFLCVVMFVCSGCGGIAGRGEMPDTERVRVYELTHGTDADGAFAALEEWAALTYVSSKDVVQMRNDKARRMVLKPVHRANIMGNPVYFPYAVVLGVSEKTVTARFEFLHNEHGGLPGPTFADEMMLSWDRMMADAASRMGGEVVKSPAPPSRDAGRAAGQP